MYKLLIYWDDGRVETAVTGTQEDIINAMPGVAERVGDEALWQIVYEQTPYDMTNAAKLVPAQMGVNGHAY